jgi:hypothetical protein
MAGARAKALTGTLVALCLWGCQATQLVGGVDSAIDQDAAVDWREAGANSVGADRTVGPTEAGAQEAGGLDADDPCAPTSRDFSQDCAGDALPGDSCEVPGTVCSFPVMAPGCGGISICGENARWVMLGVCCYQLL